MPEIRNNDLNVHEKARRNTRHSIITFLYCTQLQFTGYEDVLNVLIVFVACQ